MPHHMHCLQSISDLISDSIGEQWKSDNLPLQDVLGNSSSTMLVLGKYREPLILPNLGISKLGNLNVWDDAAGEEHIVNENRLKDLP